MACSATHSSLPSPTTTLEVTSPSSVGPGDRVLADIPAVPCCPQMKISFNDKRLQTTFEYPPESSLAQEDEEEEEEAAEEAAGSGPGGAVEKPFAFFLPRATFVNSVGPESPRLLDGSSGECPPSGMRG